MASLSDHIKIDLDECRMAVLGTQVLMMLQFEAGFEDAFDPLPGACRTLVLTAACLLVVTFGLLVSIPAYHRIVDDGDSTQAFRDFGKWMTLLAMVPLALALSIDVHVAAAKVAGVAAGIGAGAGALFIAALFWCAWGGWKRIQSKHPEAAMRDPQSVEHPKLHERVSQALTEARVILPGAQAMLGFAFITMLMSGFDKLPDAAKYVHLVCLGLIALAVVLLLTPAAFHRIAESGEDSERLVRLTSRMVLGALVPLGIAISGDLYVVFQKVTDSTPIAIVAGAVAAVFFFALWFGYTCLKKRAGHASPERSSESQRFGPAQAHAH